MKHHKYILGGLLIWLCCGQQAWSATPFETFEAELAAIKTETGQLALVQQTEARIHGWPAEDQGRFLHKKGLVLEVNDQIEAAKTAFTESIEVFEKAGRPNKYWAQSLQDRSYMDYLLTNDPTTYCVDRETAAEVARKANDPEAITGSLVFLAFCFRTGFDEFKKGLMVLEEAATVAREYELAGGATAMIHNATGNLYRANDLHDKAYEYYQKAYEHWLVLDDTQDIYNMLHNMVGESVKMGKWQQADNHIKGLFELAAQHPEFSDFTFFAHYNEAYKWFHQNQFADAIEAANMALELAHTTSETYFINVLEGIRVVAYFRDQQYQKAGQLADQFLQSGELPESQRTIDQQVRLIRDFSLGQYESATEQLWQLLDAEQASKQAFIENAVAAQSLTFDKTLSEFQQQALADKLRIKQLELAQQTKQNTINELELEQQAKQNKINRLTGFVALTLAVALAILSWFLYRSRRFYLRSSRTDFLTKTNNRRQVFALGTKQLAKAKANQQPYAVGIIDIDDFKKLNDQYGHDLGDQVLKHLVNTTESLLLGSQQMGRMGGEEFVLLLPELDEATAIEKAETIRLTVAGSQLSHNDQQVSYTISIGVFVCQGDLLDFEQCINRADQALYQAKSQGKNQVVQAQPPADYKDLT